MSNHTQVVGMNDDMISTHERTYVYIPGSSFGEAVA